MATGDTKSGRVCNGTENSSAHWTQHPHRVCAGWVPGNRDGQNPLVASSMSQFPRRSTPDPEVHPQCIPGTQSCPRVGPRVPRAEGDHDRVQVPERCRPSSTASPLRCFERCRACWTGQKVTTRSTRPCSAQSRYCATSCTSCTRRSSRSCGIELASAAHAMLAQEPGPRLWSEPAEPEPAAPSTPAVR